MFVEGCFLCNPDPNLVYERDEHHYAMLGLGPVVEGYSIIATRAHLRSVLDVDDFALEHLEAFGRRVATRLGATFGKCIVTEHGRVPACDFLEGERHEPHCYHAHQLVFPITLDLAPSLIDRGGTIVTAGSMREAKEKVRAACGPDCEYLFFQDVVGRITILVPGVRPVRQFFRLIVADRIGDTSLADWRSHPNRQLVDRALPRLGRAAVNP